MKLSGAGQAEMIKIAAMVTLGAVTIYVVKQTLSGAVKSVKDAIDTVASAPGKAIEAVKEVAKQGGSTWKEGITPQYPPDAPPPVTDPYAPRYNNPMVNNDGIDFNQF